MIAPAVAVADVSTPRQIADRPAAHCQAPRWAPDGSHVAYEVYDPKQDLRETWIQKLAADGRKEGAPTEVTVGRADAAALLQGKKPPVVDFEWAPSMKLINRPYVFSSRGPKKNLDLFADGSWLTNNAGNDGQASWSPDGRYIAFTSQQADSGDIYLIDLQGDSKPIQLTFWPTATEFSPRFSPGGRALLFIRSQSGAKGQDIGLITDATKARETTRMVTEWNGDEIRPSWSPDGKLVAFYSNKDNQSDKVFDLWVIGADGQNARKLAANVVVDDHRGAAWAPDSSTVFFVLQDFKSDNPVRWVKVDGSAKGVLDTGTQLNSDLAIYGTADKLQLAFKALGQKGSPDKTWERLYLVTFSMADLKPEAQ